MKELQRSYTRSRRLFQTPRVASLLPYSTTRYYSIANAKQESQEKLGELGIEWGHFSTELHTYYL